MCNVNDAHLSRVRKRLRCTQRKTENYPGSGIWDNLTFSHVSLSLISASYPFRDTWAQPDIVLHYPVRKTLARLPIIPLEILERNLMLFSHYPVWSTFARLAQLVFHFDQMMSARTGTTSAITTISILLGLHTSAWPAIHHNRISSISGTVLWGRLHQVGKTQYSLMVRTPLARLASVDVFTLRIWASRLIGPWCLAWTGTEPARSSLSDSLPASSTGPGGK